MPHPLKLTVNKLSNDDLDDLELVLRAVLQETLDYAAWLVTEDGRQMDDWESEDAATNARIMALSKALGVNPTTN